VPPKNWPGFAQTKRFSFVSAFDPSARLHTAAITWRALFDAAHASGAELPSLDVDASSSETDPALPILGPGLGQSEGLLLTEGLAGLAYTRLGRPRQSLRAASDAVPIQRRCRRRHTPARACSRPGRQLEVSVGQGWAKRPLYSTGPAWAAAFYPATPTRLAVNAQGALAVLRTHSAGEPATTADSCLVLHP